MLRRYECIVTPVASLALLKYMKASGLSIVLAITISVVCGCKSSSTAPQQFSMSGKVQLVDTIQSTYSSVIAYNAANATVRLNNSDSTTTTDANGNFTFYDVSGNAIDGVTLSNPGYAASQLFIHVPDTSQHMGLLYPNSWLAATLGDFSEVSDTEIDSVLVGFRDSVFTDSTGVSMTDTLDKGRIEIDTLVHHNGFSLPVIVRSMVPGRPAIGEVIFYVSTADTINPLDPNTFDFTYSDITVGTDSSSSITEFFITNDLYQNSKLYTGTEYTTGTKIYLRAYVSPYKNPRSYSYPGSLKPVYPFLGVYPSNSVSITLP
ncbi:MAG TPA: hypothetical protein VG537_11645 [Candidatus Kapabacteria bacterium]|nr:hypothetical protein [Candidatus Kapabacteria bacterium]